VQGVLVFLGFIGFAGFGISAFSLFILWGYLLLRITGHYSGTVEQDARARKLGVFFGKLFAYSIAYAVVLVIVIHIVGPPH
jgi:hypothetical protein